MLTGRWGSGIVAWVQLMVSGLCCLVAPWMLFAPWWLFVSWMMAWGLAVSGDSPQFSALTARNSPPEVVGGVLEEECGALLRAFFAGHRPSGPRSPT